MAEGKRPRQSDELAEAFVVEDANAFTYEGALEFLMDHTVQDEDHKIISKNLIDKFGDLDGVLSADFKTLCGVKGMNSHMATLLKLVDHISSSRWTNNSGNAATKMPTSMQQNLLGSDAHSHPKSRHIKAKKRSVTQKKTTETRCGIFTNAVLKEAIEILPKLPDTEDRNVTRQFLKKNLPFSAENTRDRHVPYITNRLFVDGCADRALRSFTKIFAGRQELRGVCFYRFCKAEPLMLEVADDRDAGGRLFRGQAQSQPAGAFIEAHIRDRPYDPKGQLRHPAFQSSHREYQGHCHINEDLSR